ncbi:MAG: pyrimidine utilization protein D [Pseudomonadota bacterium]
MKYTHLRAGRNGAPTLVLSAGLGGAAGFWKPHIDAFSAEFDLLLYDQRGTGENSEPLGPTSIADMAEDVLAICDAAGVDRFDLIGHALGGLIGLDLAARAPSRLDRLIAINAWPEIDHHTSRCFDIRLGVLAEQGLAPFVALQQNFLYPPGFISAHPQRIAAEEAHAIAHFQGAETLTHRINALRAFTLPDMSEGSARVLLMASKDDALVDVAQSERLAARVPKARLILYDQGGHALNITEQARFERDALEFLNDR